MVELLDELKEKRERYNLEAEQHKYSRDKSNDETRRWVERRDKLNAEVRKLMEEAGKHRQERDRLNDEVRKTKVMRDEWNRKVNDMAERVSRLKRDNLPRGGVPVGQLKRKLKAMEFQQMTSVLSPDKERELIDAISKLQAEIKEREKVLEENTEVRRAVLEAKEAKRIAEETHKNVEELAEAAQREHEAMMKIYEQSDAVRKEADGAQADFIKAKTLADEEHRKHIELIRQVHDYDKIMSGLLQKKREARSSRDEGDIKKEAADIYERFKKGEKLSTEDLLTLQKSGYL
ncbi:MAG: phosphoserine phosphatase [Euryarchaeota archaeon]|nr:phosphoserine phosphatase [Euryarchaeota archaeon]